MNTEKLQKILANIGLGSRRELESWISAGRVQVNGVLAKLGDRVGGRDKIAVDGRLVTWQLEKPQLARVLIYHKPEGEMCTRRDPEGRPTVYEHLPKLYKQRWLTIGRLDVNTSGLLLFTTDGELANCLMHPSFEIEREYAVRVLGKVTDEVLRNLRQGVELDDGYARFDQVVEAGGEGANHWYHVVIKEGRKREVRRLWEAQGVKVSRLIRVRYGTTKLPPTLKRGRFLDLEAEELKELYKAAGLKPPMIEKKVIQQGDRHRYEKEKMTGYKPRSAEKAKKTLTKPTRQRGD